MLERIKNRIKKAAKDTDNLGNKRETDAEIVDAEIDNYINEISNQLAYLLGGADQVLVADSSDGPSCHHTTCLAEDEAWRQMPGFWEWFV